MSMLDNFPCQCGQCSECRASHTRYVREVHQKKRDADRLATERENRKALNDAEREMRAATYRFEALKKRVFEELPAGAGGLERDWFDINDR